MEEASKRGKGEWIRSGKKKKTNGQCPAHMFKEQKRG